DLPSPGGTRAAVRVGDVTARVQFHLSGPGGGSWYLACRDGEATRHDGTAAGPDVHLHAAPAAAADVPVHAAAADWHAIQSGDLDRVQAFLGGKLRVEGDLSLLMQL